MAQQNYEVLNVWRRLSLVKPRSTNKNCIGFTCKSLVVAVAYPPHTASFRFEYIVSSHVAQIRSIPLLDNNNPGIWYRFPCECGQFFLLSGWLPFRISLNWKSKPFGVSHRTCVCGWVCQCQCLCPMPFTGLRNNWNVKRTTLVTLYKNILVERSAEWDGRVEIARVQLPLPLLLIMFSIRYFREWICYLLFGSHVFCSTVRLQIEGGRQQQQPHRTNVDFKDLIELDLLA